MSQAARTPPNSTPPRPAAGASATAADRGLKSRGMPDGWYRQAIQLPVGVAADFRELSSTRESGVKVMGTAAIACYLGMPPELREEIERYVLVSAWNRTPIDSGEIWAFIRKHVAGGAA